MGTDAFTSSWRRMAGSIARKYRTGAGSWALTPTATFATWSAPRSPANFADYVAGFVI